jgi:hypothetical protein
MAGQGRPVKRNKGFGTDIMTFTRLRAALKTDSRLDKNLVARAVKAIDEIIDVLAELHKPFLTAESQSARSDDTDLDKSA